MKTAPMKSALAEALEKAGKVLRRHFGNVAIRYKGRANILTAADLESERTVLEVIKRRFPEHDHLTEETEAKRTGSDFLWVVDPIDGTTNFAHGFPVCCVSIALLHKGKPLLAGIYDPFRDECFTAEKGKGASINGKPLKVSRTERLSTALLITGFPYDRAKKPLFYTRIYADFMVRCHDVRRSGSAALDMAWIAAGRADGFWEFNLSPWDVAAGLLLVEEAGGSVTDFSGRPWGAVETFGRQTLATNGAVHREMRRTLEKRL